MHLAGKHLEMLGYTSVSIVRPLLLPEMVERIAAMLNYFLLQLTGPQRKVLKVKDPEKYGFKPRDLLGQVRTPDCCYQSYLPLRSFFSIIIHNF
jgi:ubiquitin conjugation factor E4 B